MPEMDSQPVLPCQDLDGASHSDGDESIGSASVVDDDDDDEKVPFWFRQISAESSATMVYYQLLHMLLNSTGTSAIVLVLIEVNV